MSPRETIQGKIHALARGELSDPFTLLGPHRNPKGDWTVRALAPNVESLELVWDGGEALMRRRHTLGVYEGRLPAAAGPAGYRLRARRPGEDAAEYLDPYAFEPVLGELDLHLLAEGRHYDSYKKMGAHPVSHAGVAGTAFAVWAPNATRVSVVGDFNGWDGRRHPMRPREGGIWELFVPGLETGALYKFEIQGPPGAPPFLRSDPYAFSAELRPKTASRVHGLTPYAWSDADWMGRRARRDALHAPMTVYEAHLGSWKLDRGATPSYRWLADELLPYVKDLGFTHVETLPVTEHPYDKSWGYQTLGYYAPTSRFGEPADFKHFVDRAHALGLGVLLDWVPAHFPNDAHGLRRFDGTALFEHEDPRKGDHPDWKTSIFNYGRNEVRNFLVSNALFWMREFHIDGLRVDAVASMLYLDYSRKEGEWIPNVHGGRENLEAIEFLRELNTRVHAEFPGAMVIAEESTAWPGVSRPAHGGGLGFTLKWNLGWMHDTLQYMSEDPVHRKYHHEKMTFGLVYAFHENFLLALSHDEVVHGKGSLLSKMAGDDWQKFANLRAYYAFMYAHPGKKLLFMGSEFAQRGEWDSEHQLDWAAFKGENHRGIQALVRELNRLAAGEKALYELDFEPAGFEWIDLGDRDQSVYSFIRRDRTGREPVVAVFNMTPVPRPGYKVGVPEKGAWNVILDTDEARWGGSGAGPKGPLEAHGGPWHGRAQSVTLDLPPLGAVLLKR